jgi:large subunit ribosomal protein L5
MNITIVTTADSDKDSFALLEKMGMPFTKGSN